MSRFKEEELKRHYCRHCSLGHIYVCNCGHSHDEHIFLGGCTHVITDNLGSQPCKCERYSQTQKKKEKKIVPTNNNNQSISAVAN